VSPASDATRLAGHADAEARRSVLTVLPCATLVTALGVCGGGYHPQQESDVSPASGLRSTGTSPSSPCATRTHPIIVHSGPAAGFRG